MASKDLHYSSKPNVALNIQAISTDTTTNGAILDMQGYEGVEFVIQSGTLTDGTYTPLLQDGEDASLSDAANVSTDFLLGTYADATFAATDDNKAKYIGYVGKKRYVRLSLVSASTSSGGTLGATALQCFPRHNPTAGADTPTG